MALFEKYSTPEALITNKFLGLTWDYSYQYVSYIIFEITWFTFTHCTLYIIDLPYIPKSNTPIHCLSYGFVTDLY